VSLKLEVRHYTDHPFNYVQWKGRVYYVTQKTQINK
jgi:hypothetical protein